MTIYTPSIEGRPGPKYQAIAQAIADDIATGTLSPGTRMPPHRDLAWRLGVTVGTVSRAYAQAQRRGLVHGEVGRGTYVLDPLSTGATSFAPAPLAPIGDNSPIELTRNAPPQGPHVEALASSLDALAKTDPAALFPLLAYHEAAGPLSHREAGCRWLARVGLETSPDALIMTGGAQDALALSITVLTGPGETILVERTSYSELLNAARFHRRQLAGVEMDEEGVIPEALAAAARRHEARTVFLVPTLQNPTNAIMSTERRAQVVAVARECGLTIVEDDVYGYLLEERPAPIAAQAPERVVYLTSVSKAISPGLRVGWLTAPAHLHPAFLEARTVSCVSQPPLTGEIATRWLEDGTADQLLAWARQETRARHAIAAEVLAGHNINAHPASFHLLLELPNHWEGDAFAAAMRSEGVGLLSVRAFAADPSEGSRHVRISLSQPGSHSLLRKALEKVAAMIETRPQRGRAII
jgi:DNA-binding transcriptional MocR family regulator